LDTRDTRYCDIFDWRFMLCSMLTDDVKIPFEIGYRNLAGQRLRRKNWALNEIRSKAVPVVWCHSKVSWMGPSGNLWFFLLKSEKPLKKELSKLQVELAQHHKLMCTLSQVPSRQLLKDRCFRWAIRCSNQIITQFNSNTGGHPFRKSKWIPS